MNAGARLALADPHPGRTARDRLEVLTALISGPSFDPLFRSDVIRIPAAHPAYRWDCAVAGCERPRAQRDLCAAHAAEWQRARAAGMTRREFAPAAGPLKATETPEPVSCRICLHRPAFNRELGICHRHRNRWRAHVRKHGAHADFGQWLASQHAYHSYGGCRVRACDELAAGPLGLCVLHEQRYHRNGKPGAASLPLTWFGTYEYHGQPVPVSFRDEPAFRQWCAEAPPVMRAGQLNLRGLRPLLRAEIQWGLHTHAQGERASWELPWIQSLVDVCTRRGLGCLADLDLTGSGSRYRVIVPEMLDALRLIYFSPSDARDAGWIDTEHFGIRFPAHAGTIDLTTVSQRWLRDLLWDHMAGVLRSPKCPRTGTPLAHARRACVELSAFLQADAPAGGHDAALLRAEHMHRFVAGLRHREQHHLSCLGTYRADGQPTIATQVVRRLIFNYGRALLREALENGAAEQLGLDRGFIAAMPAGGRDTKSSRNPFTDDVARALADESNLAQLAEVYDPDDRGLRDIWEAIILTGRRASEVLKLRFECIGRYNELPLLWHDQTKVGNYNEAVRIPERLYQQLAARQHKTLAWFADTHGGRQPGTAERNAMALFPSARRNPAGRRPVSYTWFHAHFKPWVDQLDIGHVVAHQARHTMATRLLRHGATLSHIRRYLGHVSDRMAEHYAKVAVSEIEDILQHVWVAGPGAASPGELLSSHVTPMNRLQAEALALDLSRRSTPAEGGCCTFQPVVDGGACPWKLNCEGCGKFVISGADLLYWRRKREQWNSIAERAPDDATASYLHQVFEPTARAIDGLEQALAGLGLLDDALALDLRRPQDYFQRLWNTGFRATDLARAADDQQAGPGDDPAAFKGLEATA
ncbi:MAG: tyrosine-type recombinase/integrase [Streptosporangiaceae bacterium]